MGKAGEYKKSASAYILTEWLKRGATVEQIKIAAQEIDVKIEPDELVKALRMYETWKTNNPEKVSKTYGRMSGKRGGRS